ncbi:MAG: nucleotide exchange factor GrpE [Candidatus Bathyarchaeota archaeon]|jgi:molecular chaperone GrpE
MTPRKSNNEKLEKKIMELEASLEDMKETSDRYLNQLKYVKADLENLQKRTQKSIDEALEKANGRIMMRLLTILDELDLAISAAKNHDGDILEGVEMVRGNMWKLLESEGVETIEATGKPFDPNLHEAVLEAEVDSVNDGYIAEELRRGYRYKGRVLRPSMVKVARTIRSDNVHEVELNE